MILPEAIDPENRLSELLVGVFENGGSPQQPPLEVGRKLELTLVDPVVIQVRPGMLQQRAHLDLRAIAWTRSEGAAFAVFGSTAPQQPVLEGRRLRSVVQDGRHIIVESARLERYGKVHGTVSEFADTEAPGRVLGGRLIDFEVFTNEGADRGNVIRRFGDDPRSAEVIHHIDWIGVLRLFADGLLGEAGQFLGACLDDGFNPQLTAGAFEHALDDGRKRPIIVLNSLVGGHIGLVFCRKR